MSSTVLSILVSVPVIYSSLSLPLRPHTPQGQLKLIYRIERGGYGYGLVLKWSPQTTLTIFAQVALQMDLKGAERDYRGHQVPPWVPSWCTSPSSLPSRSSKTLFPLTGYSSMLLCTWPTCIHFSKPSLNIASESLKTLQKESLPFPSVPCMHCYYHLVTMWCI